MTTLKDDFCRVWPLLKPAIAAYGDTHRKRHIWEAIDSGHAQLWTTANAALVSEIKVWPSGLKEAIGWLAGGDIAELLAIQPQFEAWARSKGCSRIGIINGRVGWGRKLDGFTPCGALFAKELT